MRRSLSFPKSRRLTRASEFERVRREGRAHHGGLLILGVLAAKQVHGFRAGFVTARRLGGAAVRNRVRRRLKEIVRLSAATGLSSGHDYVLIGRRAALSLPFDQITEDFKRALRRLRVPK